MKLPDALRLSPRWTPYVLLSPFVVLFLVFGVFPLAFSLWIAFQSWEPTSGLAAMQFVGLDNFVFALGDEWFWKSLMNTGWLALASGLTNALFNSAVAIGDVVRVVLLFYLMPIWAVLLARLLMGEPLRALSIGLVLLAVIGAGIVLWRPGVGVPLPASRADWLGVAGGMFFAPSK